MGSEANMRRVIRVLIWIVYLLAMVGGLTLSESPARAPASRKQLLTIVAQIQKADYEGDRAALRRLYRELEPYTDDRDKKISSRVRYWRGFAAWRRALNGFNETVDPDEQKQDLTACVNEFEQALAIDPSFVDARVGTVSCLVGFYYVDKNDAEHMKAYIQEFKRLRADAEAAAVDNPRILWMLGGCYWYIPAERGGGEARAFETYERGLKAARMKSSKPTDPLDPSWGEPELLMSLAWSNMSRSTPDLDAAEANARAALALVPRWHYVSDILVPKIQEAKKRPPATPALAVTP